jgi:hypothetical protein
VAEAGSGSRQRWHEAAMSTHRAAAEGMTLDVICSEWHHQG